MAWFTHRPASPKPSFPDHARPSWRRRLRRSRILSWGLCFLVLILIVFWPQNRSTSTSKSSFIGGQKRPAPRPRADTGDAPALPKKPKKRQRTPLQSPDHLYRTDGLLEVNPKGKHPILELIDTSEIHWKRKLERQSKTFKQAVDEYKRRYKRSPPKGFDVWWDFVDFHGVKLVDEYDSIHAHLQPFWGIAPTALRATQADFESYPDTFTIGKLSDASPVELLNHTLQPDSTIAFQRLENQLELLEDVEEHLPQFRATFTMHDGPQHMTSWEMRRQAQEAAERGQYIDVERVAASVTTRGWAAACPPNTPIHSYIPSLLSESPNTDPLSPQHPHTSKTKTFIYNHRLSMSPCLHPTHLTLNGYLSQYHYTHQFGPNAKPSLPPTFSICVSPLHGDILAVAPEQYSDEVGVDPAWGDKVDERLLWRGSNTGILHQAESQWNSSQRIRLVEMGTRRGGETRVLLPRGSGGSGSGGVASGGGGRWDGAAVGYGEAVRTSVLNAAFMDVAFVGQPIQCREPVCEELQGMFEWRGYQSWQDAWMYKYIMDLVKIDGNGWSARFKRLMTSNSLVFKSTIFPEWYTERIMPWVHYIPVQVDLSDIYDILAFFRGDPFGAAGAHDDLAERIATAGKNWSQEFYRREDMTAYHFRLFLEYARVMSLDREGMTFREGEDDRDDRDGVDM